MEQRFCVSYRFYTTEGIWYFYSGEEGEHDVYGHFIWAICGRTVRDLWGEA